MPETKWVRLSEDVDCGLRRGGWYLATSIGQSDVVLQMSGKFRAFPREFFEISAAGPTRWTVVSHAGNASQIPTRWSNGYGVCPSCRWRQLIHGRPDKMLCEGCYDEFEVDWDTLYLKAG